ncbi:major facilitator superfamily domain-containing protein [Microdochium bolleyi]|uniref:Major facilitator superfamily domain-containing protein n=1 Tax=Microdochium bolleyi TaxID=196109 RepID=A0A136ILS3_9PEZI|nr:major facilitator superfamily domain-containing protein [Microdochium bolleyi]
MAQITNAPVAAVERQPDMGSTDQDQSGQDTTEDLQKWRIYLTTLALGLMGLLAAFDASMLGPALPAITSEFQALDHIGWYTSAYLLAQMPFQLVFSRLAAFYEAKLFNIVALAVFEVGSVICALAPNSSVFILGRAVSGLGAAGMVAGGFVVIGNIPIRERPRLLAIFFALQSIASTAGPTLSGALTDSYLTWPVGAVALGTFYCVVPKAPSSKARLPLSEKLRSCYPLDTSLLIACLVLLFLAFQWAGSSRSYSHPRVWGCLLGSGLLAVGFAVLQVRNKGNGLVPLRLITHRSIAGSCLISLCNGASNITHITILPTYLQTVHGLSATISGLYQLPITGSNISAMAIASTVVSKTGKLLPFLYAGPPIYLVGAVLLQRLQPDSPLSWILGSAVPVGAGFGSTVQGCLLTVQNACSTPETREDMPVAAVMEVFAQQLGRSVAISIAQSVFVQKLYTGLEALAASSSPSGEQNVLLGLAGQGLEQMVRTMDTFEPGMRTAVRGALSLAVTTAFILPVAAMAIASVATLLVERKNIDVSKKPLFVVEASPEGAGGNLISSTVQDASPGDAEKRA